MCWLNNTSSNVIEDSVISISPSRNVQPHMNEDTDTDAKLGDHSGSPVIVATSGRVKGKGTVRRRNSRQETEALKEISGNIPGMGKTPKIIKQEK